MFGGILKLTLFVNVLFLSVILLWQAATADTSPTLAINNNLAKSIDDVSHLSTNNNNHRGAPIVKRSLQPTVDQELLIDSSPFRSRPRHRGLRRKLHSAKLKPLPNVFQSADTYNKNLQASKRIQAAIDNRLKRFRMLDPDEFQEMLNSLSYQMPDEQTKEFNSMDTIDGMQLENYWSRK